MDADVYYSNNILESPDSKVLVVHPEGTLIFMKVSKDLSYWNWTQSLTKKGVEHSNMPDDKRGMYLEHAQNRLKEAYAKIRPTWAKERSVRLTPMIKNLKPADTDAEAAKLCKEAHDKLFNAPNFGIKDLVFVKAISTRADWNIVRHKVTSAVLYRIRYYIVIAKSKTNGQCYAMFNSITQEYAGGWQDVRCSTFDEGGGFYLLNDKDEMKWGLAYEIECF
jgi:hypothetical protein